MNWMDENAKYYFYGMRLRGFAPGCQPMEGFKDTLRSLVMEEYLEEQNYYDILIYDRQLTDAEIAEYELDYLYSFEYAKDEMKGLAHDLLNKGFHSWELLTEDAEYIEANRYLSQLYTREIDDAEMERVIAEMENLEDE